DGAPLVATPALPRLACRTVSEAKSSSVARTEHSPDDLGVGAAHLPVSDDSSKVPTEQVRYVHARNVLIPSRNTETAPDRDEAAPRAIVSGYGTTGGDDRIVVVGPVKDAMSLRRNVAF